MESASGIRDRELFAAGARGRGAYADPRSSRSGLRGAAVSAAKRYLSLCLSVALCANLVLSPLGTSAVHAAPRALADIPASKVAVPPLRAARAVSAPSRTPSVAEIREAYRRQAEAKAAAERARLAAARAAAARAAAARAAAIRAAAIRNAAVKQARARVQSQLRAQLKAAKATQQAIQLTKAQQEMLRKAIEKALQAAILQAGVTSTAPPATPAAPAPPAPAPVVEAPPAPAPVVEAPPAPAPAAAPAAPTAVDAPADPSPANARRPCPPFPQPTGHRSIKRVRISSTRPAPCIRN